MLRPKPFTKLTLLGSLMIALQFLTVSLGFGKSPYDSFFDDLSSEPRVQENRSTPPRKSEPAKKPLPSKRQTEAGRVKCYNCSTMENTAANVGQVNEITEKLAPKKKAVPVKRAQRVLDEFEDTPASTGPTPDSAVWRQFPDIAAYSDSKEVATAIRIAKSRAKRASIGMCYAHVKDAIYNNEVKLTSHRLVGNRVFPDPKKRRGDFGQTAIKNFEDEGFDNLLTNPETKHLITNAASAPKGAIMIYRGGSRGGHIEIKTDYGAKADYVSDFKSHNSALYNELQGRRSPSGRMELVGVMVKRSKEL